MTTKINASNLKVLLVVILIIRFSLDFFGNWSVGEAFPHSFSFPQQKHWDTFLIPDDMEIARTAYFYLKTDQFLTDVSFDRPKFRDAKIWPSALRNRYNILYHALLIKAYEYLHGPLKLESTNNLSIDFFVFYSIVIFCLKWLLKLVAIFSLYRCATLFLSETVSVLFLIGWEIYPSNFYIFPLNCFDTWAAPVVSIIVCQFILLSGQKKINYKQIIFLGLLCCFAFTIKFHIIAITFSMCLFAIIYGIAKRNTTLVYSFAGIFLLHFCVIVPLLVSTKNTLGHPVISTQSGVNLFYGHNPTARGSWSNKIWVMYPEVLDPILASVKKDLSADEYTETEAYKKLAVEWAMGHPKQEVILSVKKVLIYFTPYNFISWQINPLTLLVHLGFIALTFFLLIHPSRFTIEYWLLIVPAWSIVAFNVLYFVEYRWRYYVEPEMILSAFILVKIIYDKTAKINQAVRPN